MKKRRTKGMTEADAKAIIDADHEIEMACRRSRQFTAGYLRGRDDERRDQKLWQEISGAKP